MVTRKPKVRFTYDDYCRLPADRRYELIDGEFYAMAPAPGRAHQKCLIRLFRYLDDWIGKRRLGEILVAPFDVILSEHDTMQPDLLYVANANRGIITERACEGAPDLVVEILSPATAGRDRGLKRERYAAFGVREYWLVDPAAGTVEVLTWAEGEYLSLGTCSGEMSPDSRVLPGLAFPAQSIFQEA